MNDDFPREILKVAVAYICSNFGFQTAERAAHETLVDILQCFIDEVGFTTKRYTEHGNRIESNFHDLIFAFRELRISLRDLILFASATTNIDVPFTRAIPEFPVRARAKQPRSLRFSELPMRPSYVPSFLPTFPEPHTFAKTPVYVEREKNPSIIRQLINTERSQIEENLTKLHRETTPHHETSLIDYQSYLFDRPSEAATVSQELAEDKSRDELPVATKIEPTPLDKDSPYITKLYQVPKVEPFEDEVKVTVNQNEELEKRKKVERILALQHKDGLEFLDKEEASYSESNAATPSLMEGTATPPTPTSPKQHLTDNMTNVRTPVYPGTESKPQHEENELVDITMR
jgi:transcription initiation factor TFIID subunit 8